MPIVCRVSYAAFMPCVGLRHHLGEISAGHSSAGSKDAAGNPADTRATYWDESRPKEHYNKAHVLALSADVNPLRSRRLRRVHTAAQC